jgi:hypothetical protein
MDCIPQHAALDGMTLARDVSATDYKLGTRTLAAAFVAERPAPAVG